MTDETNTTNYITVLRTKSAYQCLAKHFNITENGEIGVVPYDNVAYFSWRQVPVGSIQDLLALLTELNGRRREAIIRGVPTNEFRQMVRRSASNFPEHPEGSHFVMLDIDGIPTPGEVHPCSVEAVRYVISLLPAEFKNASCVYQFSNSAGILKPDGTLLKEGIRVHLWFMLNQRIPGPLLAAYLESFCFDTNFFEVALDRGGTPMIRTGVDLAPIKSPVQLHYTASPVVMGDVRVDIPDGQRLGWIAGAADSVIIPEIPSDLLKNVAERRKALRKEWALTNGFSKKSMGVWMGRQSRVVEYLEAPSAVQTGRTLDRTELAGDGHLLRLFFAAENTPGSWYVRRSAPWMGLRYGDGAEVPLKELCPAAWEKVQELGWASEISTESVTEIPKISFDDFSLSESGVTFTIVGAKSSRTELLSSPLIVVAMIRDLSSENWSYLVKFWDPDGGTHEIPIRAEELQNEGFRTLLMQNGAQCYGGTSERAWLAKYIQRFPVKERRILLERTGWVEEVSGCFTLPNEIFGEFPSQDGFQWDRKILHNLRAYRSEGTLEDWINQIGEPCEKNCLLVLGLCTSFLPSFLKPMRLENFGVHIRGSSSTGKTKALMVASSVWGDPREFVGSWRTTDNALEGLAASRNDSLLALDELAQASPNSVAESVYLLGNGVGKARMRSDTTMREPAKFRLLFLSSGEVSLREHMARANGRVMGGHQVRFIDLRADAGANMGVFQQLHGFNSPRELAQHLEQATTRFFGTPIRVFLHRLLSSPESHSQVLDGASLLVRQLENDWHVPRSDPQVQRVCSHFAWLAAAGEVAIELEVLPFSKGHAIEACQWGFRRWLEDRGGLESTDLLRALEEMEFKLQTYGFTRFDQDPVDCATLNIPIPRANPCWGFLQWINGDRYHPVFEFWISVSIFEQEFAAGVNKKAFAEMLVSRGFMDEPKSVRRTIPLVGQSRVYVIKGSILRGLLPEEMGAEDSAQEGQVLQLVK